MIFWYFQVTNNFTVLIAIHWMWYYKYWLYVLFTILMFYTKVDDSALDEIRRGYKTAEETEDGKTKVNRIGFAWIYEHELVSIYNWIYMHVFFFGYLLIFLSFYNVMLIRKYLCLSELHASSFICLF